MPEDSPQFVWILGDRDHLHLRAALRALPGIQSAPGLVNDLGVPASEVDELLLRVRELARKHQISLPVYRQA